MNLLDEKLKAGLVTRVNSTRYSTTHIVYFVYKCADCDSYKHPISYEREVRRIPTEHKALISILDAASAGSEVAYIKSVGAVVRNTTFTRYDIRRKGAKDGKV